jgi:transglutaminase-like putative cysteine protease
VRWLLLGLAALGVTLLAVTSQAEIKTTTPPTLAKRPSMQTVGQQEYIVRQSLILTNAGPGEPEKQNVWVALIHDFPPYQTVKSVVVSPKGYSTVVDEYGNRYAEFDVSDHPAGASKTITVETHVVVNELTYDLSKCQGESLTEFLQPELHIESANPQIIDLARVLAAGKTSACQKVRSFYEYIGDHLFYTYNAKNWGAQATLGKMGADCTEYAALLVALSRAQGIPARYFEGLRYFEGAGENGSRIEHAWPDVYFPGIGWVALDPTLGRFPLKRDDYFAHYTPDHIIVTMGGNPSTLRGSSYWTHLYWPGNVTRIDENASWSVDLIGGG